MVKDKNSKKDDDVCQDQDTFNNAFMKAVDDYPKEKYNQLSTGEKTSLTIQYIVYLVLGLVFIIWAIFLAQKSKDKNITYSCSICICTNLCIFILHFFK